MTYTIRPQAHSFLILATDPAAGNRGESERLLAVCGNRADATRIVRALQLLDGRQEETQA